MFSVEKTYILTNIGTPIFIYSVFYVQMSVLFQ